MRSTERRLSPRSSDPGWSRSWRAEPGTRRAGRGTPEDRPWRSRTLLRTDELTSESFPAQKEESADRSIQEHRRCVQLQTEFLQPLLHSGCRGTHGHTEDTQREERLSSSSSSDTHLLHFLTLPSQQTHALRRTPESRTKLCGSQPEVRELWV